MTIEFLALDKENGKPGTKQASWQENKLDHVLEINLVFKVGLGWWSVKVLTPQEIPKGDVTQDQLWNQLDRRSQLATRREILKSHERIGEHIRELRRQVGMRLPGGFQTERLVEMLEECYGGEQMLEIERDIMQHGIFSRFYNETKTYFNDFRREHVTEALLRKEWQGKE